MTNNSTAILIYQNGLFLLIFFVFLLFVFCIISLAYCSDRRACFKVIESDENQGRRRLYSYEEILRNLYQNVPNLLIQITDLDNIKRRLSFQPNSNNNRIILTSNNQRYSLNV